MKSTDPLKVELLNRPPYQFTYGEPDSMQVAADMFQSFTQAVSRAALPFPAGMLLQETMRQHTPQLAEGAFNQLGVISFLPSWQLTEANKLLEQRRWFQSLPTAEALHLQAYVKLLGGSLSRFVIGQAVAAAKVPSVKECLRPRRRPYAVTPLQFAQTWADGYAHDFARAASLKLNQSTVQEIEAERQAHKARRQAERRQALREMLHGLWDDAGGIIQIVDNRKELA